jgi:hypothetical protein
VAILVSILDDIQAALRAGAYRVTGHAADEMLDDEIAEPDLIAATLAGEVIEDYPTAFPFPACLLLGQLPDGSAVHAVWAYDAATCYSFLVTAYRPDPARWTPDLRRRVKR